MKLKEKDIPKVEESIAAYGEEYTQEYLESSKEFMLNKKKLEETMKRIENGEEEFLTLEKVFENLEYKK